MESGRAVVGEETEAGGEDEQRKEKAEECRETRVEKVATLIGPETDAGGA